LAGQDFAFDTILLADVTTSGFSGNVQEGDNTSATTQEANATSGDAVGGEVAGIVTSAGGSADVVLANASQTVDASTGDARFTSDATGFVGQLVTVIVRV